eukprot:GHVO01010789.1.p1 GENE.GHVO01010789.1~~GHVO01010789.1.p1  ORF type:complete len:203 (+),score=41.96 GHVO01010789.1:91-609(+)
MEEMDLENEEEADENMSSSEIENPMAHPAEQLNEDANEADRKPNKLIPRMCVESERLVSTHEIELRIIEFLADLTKLSETCQKLPWAIPFSDLPEQTAASDETNPYAVENLAITYDRNMGRLMEAALADGLQLLKASDPRHKMAQLELQFNNWKSDCISRETLQKYMEENSF